jgi:hypothetical protein
VQFHFSLKVGGGGGDGGGQNRSGGRDYCRPGRRGTEGGIMRRGGTARGLLRRSDLKTAWRREGYLERIQKGGRI